MMRKQLLMGITLFLLAFLSICLGSKAHSDDCDEARKYWLKGLNLNKGSQTITEDCLNQKAYFYKRAIELCPNYPEAHNNLGDVYENLGKYKEAIDEYKIAIQQNPSLAAPCFGIGDICFKNGKYEEAIEWYEKGLKLEPDKLSEERKNAAKLIIGKGPDEKNKGRIVSSETIISELDKPIMRGPGGVTNSPQISFNDKAISFALNSYQILAEAKPQLIELGNALSSDELKTKYFVIAGHTDERGDSEYNQRLSEQRAGAVKNWLIKKFPKISADRLKTIGYGEGRPISFGHNEISWTLNRRVEIKRLEPENLESLFPSTLSMHVSFLYQDKKTMRPTPMKDGMTLASHDNYRIYFRPQQECYVYIYQVDSKRMTCLFPNSKYSSLKNPVKANNDYWVPGISKWLFLDNVTGREKIYLIAVSEPSIDIQNIFSDWQLSSDEIQKTKLISNMETQFRTRGVGKVVPKPKILPNPNPKPRKPPAYKPYKANRIPTIHVQSQKRSGSFCRCITFEHL